MFCQVICILCDLKVVCTVCVLVYVPNCDHQCLSSDMYMCVLSVIIIVELLLTQHITVCTPHVCMHKFINYTVL